MTSLLYPYDATVFPQGLTSPLVMWNAPSAADVYRIHYEEANYTFDGYYPITLPANIRAPQQFWDKLVASNTGGPLALQLSRYDAVSLTPNASAKEQWTIAPASLSGAIYYWTTSGSGGMARIQPGGSFTSLNGGVCMGCHAVSSDGSTLVASIEGQVTNDGSNDNRAWVSFDLPGVTVREASTSFSGTVAVNNDGKYTVYGSQTLHLGDTAAGTLIAGSGLEAMSTNFLPGSIGLMTPAFSPDGKRLAVIEGAGSWYHNLVNGRLAIMDFDEATQAFSNYTGLALASSFTAGQQALTYPTFSPDSQWIAFNVADHPSGCDSSCDDNETQISRIALQSVAATPAVDLKILSDPATANAADKNHTNEPTFNPVARGGYFWVVVTSMRDYGNRVTGTPNNGKKRLWVAAIDKSPTPAADPSHPAFFLEGQNETTTNMRGFWTLTACTPTVGGGPCTNGFECCSGFCDNGMCVTPQTLACVGSGGACTATSDCCNDAVVTCTAGVTMYADAAQVRRRRRKGWTRPRLGDKRGRLGARGRQAGARGGRPGARGGHPGARGAHPGARGPYAGARDPLPGARGPYAGARGPHPGARGALREREIPCPERDGRRPGARPGRGARARRRAGARGDHPGARDPLPGARVPTPEREIPCPEREVARREREVARREREVARREREGAMPERVPALPGAHAGEATSRSGHAGARGRQPGARGRQAGARGKRS